MSLTVFRPNPRARLPATTKSLPVQTCLRDFFSPTTDGPILREWIPLAHPCLILDLKNRKLFSTSTIPSTPSLDPLVTSTSTPIMKFSLAAVITLALSLVSVNAAPLQGMQLAPCARCLTLTHKTSLEFCTYRQTRCRLRRFASTQCPLIVQAPHSSHRKTREW